MELRVLGSIEVRVDDESLDLGGLRQRRMLAALLASPQPDGADDHVGTVGSLVVRHEALFVRMEVETFIVRSS